MSNKKLLTTLTLWDAALVYIVYLRALRLSYTKHQAYLRSLRHILKFYGYRFPLYNFDGKRILQYADIYDPFDDDPVYKEYGQAFWKFIHWLKKNKMIPAWTAPDN